MNFCCVLRAAALVAVTLAAPCAAGAQARTDVVSLANGDRITGEVARLERGRLEFKTDDAGTLYLEWDKLLSLVAARLFEVTTTDGRRFLGTLARTTERWIAVAGADGTAALPMNEVIAIESIGRSLWRKLEGSFDAGFSYTRSAGVAQLNVNTDTVYREPGFQGRLTGSLTQTQTSDGEGADDRGALEASYLRYPWQRWFFTVVGRLETNQSLGLDLRSQIGGAVGPRLVNSNRAQMTVGAGVVLNDERGVDVGHTRNVDALLWFQTSFYTYDRPRTNLDVTMQLYPSVSNLGRHRLQLDVAVRRELWKDFFLSFSMFDTFDSRPPNPEAQRNDIGVVTSIGWSH